MLWSRAHETDILKVFLEQNNTRTKSFHSFPNNASWNWSFYSHLTSSWLSGNKCPIILCFDDVLPSRNTYLVKSNINPQAQFICPNNKKCRVLCLHFSWKERVNLLFHSLKLVDRISTHIHFRLEHMQNWFILASNPVSASSEENPPYCQGKLHMIEFLMYATAVL